MLLTGDSEGASTGHNTFDVLILIVRARPRLGALWGLYQGKG